MGNSVKYRGNPALYAARARIAERRATDLAAAAEALAEAETRAAKEALTEAGVIVPSRRHKAEPTSEPEPSSEKEY